MSAIGDLIGGNALGKQVDNFAVKTLDQRTDLRGNVVVTSRPQLTPGWRIEPNLAGRLDLHRDRHEYCRDEGQRWQ